MHNRTLPRVSVIIPARNAAATLGATLDCLLAQGMRQWEALVVDNGSSDATAALTQSFAMRDARIRSLHEVRSGASAARNAALASARAEWVAFLDADDWWAPEYLERMLAALATEPSGATAYCAYRRVSANGLLLPVVWTPGIAECPFDVFARQSGVAIHCVVTRRDLVRAVGGFDEDLRTCEDWDLWQRLARTGVPFVAVPEALAFYRLRPNSVSSDKRRMVADALTVIDRGWCADPRVPAPDPRFADGAKGNDRLDSAAYFACWCAAAEAGAGHDGSELFDLLERVPDLQPHLEHLQAAVLGGLVAGAQLPPARLTEAWGQIASPLSALLDRLESASLQRGLARRLLANLERNLLRKAKLRQPVALSTIFGQCVNINAPEPIHPPPGIDTMHLRLCAANMQEDVLVTVEIPVFGFLTADDLDCIAMEEIAPRILLRRGARHARRRFLYASAAEAARSGWRVLLASLGCSEKGPRWTALRELQSIRGRIRVRAVADAQPQSPGPGSSRAQAAAILALARADAAVPAKITNPAALEASSGWPKNCNGLGNSSFRRPDSWTCTSLHLFRRERIPNDAAQAASPMVEQAPLAITIEPETELHGIQDKMTGTRPELARHEVPEGIPVLVYRRVAEDVASSPRRPHITLKVFEAQLGLLRQYGYYSIGSAELSRFLYGAAPLRGRPVLITFDDGYMDFYNHAWPILRLYGFSAEVFVATSWIGRTAEWDTDYGPPAPLMGWDELRELQARGVRFGSLLESHTPTDVLPSTELLREAAASRAVLEARLGSTVTAAAPLYGACDERMLRILAASGYGLGFMTGGGLASRHGHPLMLPRIEVHGDLGIEDFAHNLGLPVLPARLSA